MPLLQGSLNALATKQAKQRQGKVPIWLNAPLAVPHQVKDFIRANGDRPVVIVSDSDEDVH
ncbi:hypothetical protein [Rhizobium lusitanum]|uniref:Uncharacterized protein n=1 Tax=Rhizobium lusitanum TaxID=293958 RepID=A0A7X0IY36_9HYPH|nr:hypothetical protein [Rhizobium lusitanum]MBB6489289.1 hypothetical protein [Rhizobium lusitanum]